MLSDADKQIRHRRITGTRIGAIVGLSKYKTPIDVWRELVEDYTEDLDDSEDIQRGRHLEPALLSWYEAKTGAQCHPSVAVVHPDDNRFAATPDGRAKLPDGREVNLEVKAPRRGDDWGDSGTDDIPACHVCQVALEMACTGLTLTHMPALVWGELRVYEIYRDLELEKVLLWKAAEFWNKYVATGVPPPPDGTKAYSDYLVQRFGDPSQEIKTADSDLNLDADAQEYFEIKSQLAKLETRQTEIKNRLCVQIGSAKGLKGDGWKALWYKCRARTRTDWEAYARSLGGTDDGVADHITRGEDYRQFRLTETKK